MSFSFSYDKQADAGYIHVTDGRVVDRTVQIGDGVNVDLGEDNVIIGVEVLGATTPEQFDANMWMALVMALRRCEFSDDLDEIWDDRDIANAFDDPIDEE